MLTIAASCLYPTLTPSSELKQDVLVRVDVADVGARARPDLSAVLALDVSGSMAGEPLAQVLRSAERVIDLLRRQEDADRTPPAPDAAEVSAE